MNLSDVSIQRPVLTWMMVMALLVFGVLGYARLGVDQYPDIEIPVVTVTAELEGATPEGIEEDVTEVLEEPLNTIANVRALRSTSYDGGARIEIQFELGTDIDIAVQDVRDKVAQARRDLPEGVEPPVVTRMDVGGMGIVYAAVHTTRSIPEVTEYIRQHIKPQLENISGVAAVHAFGGRERNIRIWLDGEALRARSLAATDVIAALNREHVEIPGGIVEGARREWSVKTDAQFRSLDQLEGMVVAHREGAPVHLRDVARLEDGTEDVRSVTRFNGKPGVVMVVTKKSGANTVQVVDAVYERLDQLRPILPDGIEIAPKDAFIDFSLPVREAVDETLFALMFGALLAVLVVFIFLRRLRPTLIVAAAIPLSIVATFGLIWMVDYTLNSMTLLGLTLAIGVVIDDAIIVLENIERHREGGMPARQAALIGTRQIMFAATVATFSVAVVFIPVAFAEGMIGSFLGEFGLTVAGSVIISLFVALTLTPMLASRMPAPGPRIAGSIYDRLERAFSALESAYRRALTWSLAHRGATTTVAIASFALAVFFGARLGFELMPTADSGMLFVQFDTPAGTSLEATTEFLGINERFFLALPELQGLFGNIGRSSVDVVKPNNGIIVATLVPRDQRKRLTGDLVREARAYFATIPGQKVRVIDPMNAMAGSEEMELELRGNLSLPDLDRYSALVVDELERAGGYVDLDRSLEVGQPQVRVIPDRAKAAALGVDAATLARVVQMMIGGLDVGIFKEAGSRYEIRMRLDREDRDTPSAIDDLYVRGADGKLVELRNLVRLETGAAPSAVTRVDRQRAVTISGNLDGIPLGEAVARALRIGDGVLPDVATLRPSGDAESMAESGEQFLLMLGLAILAIYMVLAAQFESFVHPLSVMLALPFSMVGALGGLWAFGMTINLFSMIGIILLVGLVTKNSILLVDYANQLRLEGMGRVEAMRAAAPVRMRPVLMTAFSMIFGVLPAALGLGPGSETRAPMAVATAAGMFSSMLLTLLIVPVLYVGLDGFADWVRGLPGRLRGGAASHPSASGDPVVPGSA